MIGNGAVMGFTPREVKEMSLWEFSAVCSGYSRTSSPTKPTKAPSLSRLDQLVAESNAREVAKELNTDA